MYQILNKSLLYILPAILLCIPISCKERYDPKIKFSETGFLVVEGYINIGTKAVTTIRLSRTTPLNAGNVRLDEREASVSIETNSGELFPLSEKEAGTYSSDSLTLPLQETYRLRVLTANKLYLSDFVTPMITPAIDSVSWTLLSHGVDIYVSTHDAALASHYYQWEFDEVWEIESPSTSFHRYNQGNWENRTAQEIKEMQVCWSYVSGINLNVQSTRHLAQNAVLNRLIKSISRGDPRLDVRYSIRVKQHVLSEDAYNYIQLILKNSENTGTFFDPMPGQLFGNVYCTSSDEPVVGFIEAYTTTYKRIFIHNSDVSDWSYDLGCVDTLVSLNSPDLPTLMRQHLALSFHVVDLIPDSVYIIPSYCADCRVRGGTSIRPPFWVNGSSELDWIDR